MLIVVTCPSCQRRYDIPSRLAGKAVRCKGCATQFRVPIPATIPSSSSPKPSKRGRREEGWAAEILDQVVQDLDDADLAQVPHGDVLSAHRPSASRGPWILVYLPILMLFLGFVAWLWSAR